MIIQPQPAQVGNCPRCSRALDVVGLRFPGWRMLVQGHCRECGHSYLQDLPSGHGLVYPATFDLDTGETYARGQTAWFADWLAAGWREPDARPVTVHAQRNHATDRATLLNCLDPTYGHSVLKLLNVQRELQEGEVIALVPESLAALVPGEVAEVWVVEERTGRLREWLLDLERWIHDRLATNFDEVRLSAAYPHPHPSTWSIQELARDIEPERHGEPTIVLPLREDGRSWGPDAEQQMRNVAEMVESIRSRTPSAGFVLTGIGNSAAAPPGVVDLRRAVPRPDDERGWLAAYRGSDLAIGVHGSHMLLPSGLAGGSIELLHRGRYRSTLQATLVAHDDPLIALNSHRTLVGDWTLSDVAPETVAILAVSLLSDRERFEALMTGPAAGASLGPIPELPAVLPAEIVDGVLTPAKPSLVFRLGRVRAQWRDRWTDLKRGARARCTRLPAIMRDARGLAFEVESRDELVTFLRHQGHFERDEIAICEAFLEPGMTAVDVGANVGAFTAVFASSVVPGGSVHAFEPLEAARRRLQRTMALNKLLDVQVHPVAVADTTGRAELFTYGPGTESWTTLAGRRIESGGRVFSAEPAGEVDTVSLDDWTRENGIERIDLLKIDVEGAEGRVLAGAERLLREGRVALALIEASDNTLAPFGTTAREVLGTIEAAGFETFIARGRALVRFRAAGRLEMANVFAVSPKALERLRHLGLAD